MWGTLIGDGIWLRLLERHHAESLFALTDRNRDHLRPWLSWVDQVREVRDSLAFIEETLGQLARGEGYALGLWLEKNLIGVIGVHPIDQINGSASIGYWLDAGHQGQGIMTRAVATVLDDLFFARGLHRVEIRVAPENHRSRAIPERLGFRMEGILREAARYGGRWGDLIVYALLDREWEAQRTVWGG
ncbi:GNAT family N-acetyltransferase [Thermoflexus sp.]|uniref:GNAT family N-acetyltransferase n=1 Tax=Thermoflexus sp. TaxID=1969742 RepID=UPI0035E41BC3